MSAATNNPQYRHWTDDDRFRNGGITIPRLWITVLLSLLIHGAAIWLWFPRTPLLLAGVGEEAEQSRPLSLRLARPKPEPATPPPAAREAPPAPRAQARPPRAPTPRSPRRPPMTVEQSEATVRVPPPSPPPVAEAPIPVPPAPAMPLVPPAVVAPAPVESDLSAYIAARKRARGEAGESPTPEQAEKARRDRIVAANLASLQSPSIGNAPKNGGGTFQLQRLGFEDAELTFYGWNKDINRRLFQRIEVRRDGNPDIQTAVIRRIIAIIREHEPGDFRWESRRLGRDVMLSARPSDNAELEQFMMQEFFTPTRQPR